MNHTGEIIAILSAVSCTATALYASEASSRLGTMTVNVLRLAMAVTISGIAISIMSREEGAHIRLSIPLKGILLGIGAGMGQGIGLVLSKIGMDIIRRSYLLTLQMRCGQ